MSTRTCPECGAAFLPRYGSQVCCSDKCQAARRKQQKKRQKRARLAQCAKKRCHTAAAERKEKARRRAEFLAARDAAYAAVAAPVTVYASAGRIIEWRGQMMLGNRSKPGKNTY